MPQHPGVLAFTVSYNTTINEIITEIALSHPFDPEDRDTVRFEGTGFKALWDTGATRSVISQRVIEALGLQPIGVSELKSATDRTTTNVFLVSIALPNRVGYPSVTVVEALLSDRFDVLIGMDIISTGDFAITNGQDTTKVSFRIPPATSHIDFAAEINERQTFPSVPRNQLCPCGSGKKYKNCHGRV